MALVGVLSTAGVSLQAQLLAIKSANAATTEEIITAARVAAAIEPIAEKTIPFFTLNPPGPPGTYWMLQSDTPPLPFNPFPELTFFPLDATTFLVDDRSVDYPGLWSMCAAERRLFAETDSSFSMMASSVLNSTYAYGNPALLTNLAVSMTGTQAVTASFSIVGGTNNVPYDILRSTNVGAAFSDWNWLGIGYTSNRYTFANQPVDQASYLLARPQKTMVVGWGSDAVSQCTPPTAITNAIMAAGGGGQSLVLLTDGSVLAWGKNDYGQGSVPTNIVGASMIAAGWMYNVALLTNGAVKAWGLNIPVLGWTMTEVPADLTNAVVISAQAMHSLALRSNGTVVAWGYNSTAGETNVPAGLSNVVAISAGYQHNLAAKSDGTVAAWGGNDFGQCDVPAGSSGVVDIAAGVAHSIALKSDGTVVAWGRNSYGETNVPSGLTNVVAIAAGGDPFNNSSYSIALKSDNTVVTWGGGEVATPLTGLSNVFAIAGGADHALALRSGPRTPVITLQPTNQYQVAGGSVTFRSRGAGLYGVTYQWKTNGVNLAGATNATLTLTNILSAQAVTYTVTVSNEVGTVTSPAVNLYLVTPPVIVSQSQPTNPIVIYQENCTLSVSATGVGTSYGFPLGYQWKLSGTNIPGATSSSYTLLGDPTTVGNYSVTVTNAAGSASAAWQVGMTYTGSYVAPGTLAYHLATNAVEYASGHTGSYTDMKVVSGWSYAKYYPTNLHLLTNAVWSTNCWLRGVRGLSATAIGFLNEQGGQGLVTMVSPRHCLFAEHVRPNQAYFVAAFLDTNNVIHWRTNLGAAFAGNDTSVGILDSDLPASVGFLPVVPKGFGDYMPTNRASIVQGIGMNQELRAFSQPMRPGPDSLAWSSTNAVPFGLSTNWNVALHGGDSSAPERLLVERQLVLFSHNSGAGGGPNYPFLFDAINERMHYLSTNWNATTDYQLVPFSLTNWPAIH